MKIPVLTIGGNSMVGSRFYDLLSNAYNFSNLSTSSGFDITDRKQTVNMISKTNASIVILFSAKTDVDQCEQDLTRDKEILNLRREDEKEIAWKNEKTAWGINVFGVKNVVEGCSKLNKKLIYISTDFVFDGKKKSYSEDDTPNPINWYGKTKFEGEKIVLNSSLDFIIARIAYPYRAIHEKKDFVRAILEKLQKGEKIAAVWDHIIRPTFIDDIVNAIDVLIQKNEKGIFHVVGSQSITPYEASIKIAKEFNLDKNLIAKTTRSEYFAKKAQRPFCLNLKNDKIGLLGVEMSSFDKGIIEVKNQIEKIINL
jgi:dTDP-4-dehydrorhamnose reductase